MSDDLRPRRSVLYMPGDNDRALRKAATLPTDAVILDLEDAVVPAAKAEARERVCEATADRRYGHREVVVRANAIDSKWFEDDVRAIADAGPDAVLLPKVSSAADVHTAEAALERAGARDHTGMWAMLETAAAVLHAEEIAHASSRLTGFVMGTNDLAKELRVAHVPGRAPLLPSLAWCQVAARDAGKVIIDAVFNDLDDAEGFERECRQGRDHGFDGKTLIHPRQLEPCNRIFAPTAEEIARARELIEAFAGAQDDDRGVVVVAGRMVEHLHVEQARRTVAQAEAIAAAESLVAGDGSS